MALNLFSLLSQRLDPSLSQNALNSLSQQTQQQNQLAEQNRANLVNEAERGRSNLAQEGLEQGRLDLANSQFNWGQTKDASEAAQQYIQMMNAGDFAGAENYARTIKGMGVNIFTDSGASAQPQQQSMPQQAQSPGYDPAKLAAQQELGKQIDSSADSIISQLGQPLPLRNGKPIGPPPGQATPAQQPPAQVAPQQAPLQGIMSQPSRPLPLVHMNIRGSESTIDPNIRAAQEKAYVDKEAQAFVGSYPARFRELMGSVQGAPDRAALAAREKAAANVGGDLFAGERAQQQAAAMSGRSGTAREDAAGDDMRAMIKDTMKATKTERQTVQKIQGLIDQFESSNTVAQRLALGAELKAMFGAAASEGERAYLLGAAGKWNAIETKVNEWTQDGKLAPDLVAMLRDASKDMQDSLHKYLQEQGGAVVAAIKSDPTLVPILGTDKAQRFADSAYYQIVGGTPPKPWKGPREPSGGDVGVSISKRSGAPNPFTGKRDDDGFPVDPRKVTLPQNDKKNFPNAPEL